MEVAVANRGDGPEDESQAHHTALQWPGHETHLQLETIVRGEECDVLRKLVTSAADQQ